MSNASKLISSLSVTFAMLFLLTYGAFAGLREGNEAFKAGDFKSAIAEYMPLADSGNIQAEYRLGRAYEISGILKNEFHRGTSGANLGQAIVWYTKAAAHGVWQAKQRLAELYAIGVGVRQDADRAAELARAATRILIEEAARGTAGAEINLAEAYRRGRGVEQDTHQAVAWLRKAAAQGDPWALNTLALQYMRGDGLPRNPVIAYALILLAASREPSFNRNRLVIVATLSTEQLAKGNALAAHWKPGLPLPDDPANKSP